MEKKTKKILSRRDFLKGTGAAAIVASVTMKKYLS